MFLREAQVFPAGAFDLTPGRAISLCGGAVMICRVLLSGVCLPACLGTALGNRGGPRFNGNFNLNPNVNFGFVPNLPQPNLVVDSGANWPARGTQWMRRRTDA